MRCPGSVKEYPAWFRETSVHAFILSSLASNSAVRTEKAPLSQSLFFLILFLFLILILLQIHPGILKQQFQMSFDRRAGCFGIARLDGCRYIHMMG